jgi:ubiquitin-activating enzyme E1
VAQRLGRSVFNDFGPKFTCVDPTGEQPLTGMIVSVDQVPIVRFLVVGG